MRSWAHPDLPRLPGSGAPPTLYDSGTRAPRRIDPGPLARLYVCGITPYDATHLGHAATYVTFDQVNRVLRDAGSDVDYAQNVTDVDDPLLERAERDGEDWRELAERETQLFRDDMEALRVIPPRAYIGVTERIPRIAADVATLLERGDAYRLPLEEGQGIRPGTADIYLDVQRRPDFGSVSGWDREQMLSVFAERGGDPDRPGKRDALDPLLWRAARPGEPSWDVAGLDAGRPGWHIECSCIANDELGLGFDIQGGGIDLLFPHHEMSAVQSDALHGPGSFARAYVHQEMVGLDGEKMSKSRGNLVLVSQLRSDGIDPMAVRLVLLDHHYRTPWEWTDDKLNEAEERLACWRGAAPGSTLDESRRLLAAVRDRVRDDLDTPGALTVIDAWAHRSRSRDEPGDGADLARDTLDALLGIRL